MKVCYIAPCRTLFPSRSASSIHMIRMCEAFANLGHEVAMIVSAQGVSEECVFEYYGVSEKFKINFIPVKAGRLGNIEYAFKASKVGKELHADLVVGRSASACSLACYRGSYVVFDSHGPIWESNLYERTLYKMMIRSSKLIKMSVNSLSLKRMYIEAGFAPKCGIDVAHNGSKPIDNAVSYGGSWPGRTGYLQAGYFGHLYPGRGVEIIVGCAHSNHDIDFHLVGGTEEDIGRWAAQYRLENLHFHGYVLPSEVAAIREKCDILLAPYQSSGVAVSGGKGDSSSYMCPIKIIEYMASGKAIICSDLPVLREVLDEDSAIFAVPDSVDSWNSAINYYKDSEIRKSFGKTALEKFNGSLTWEARASQIAGFLDQKQVTNGSV